MFKKLLLVFLLIIFNFTLVEISYGATRDATKTDIKDSLLNVTEDNNIVNTNSENGVEVVTDVLKWTKDSLTNLLVLIAVGVFLYIGVKLAFARGNPEEFKKAMMHLVYALIGIFIVSLAWAAVTLVAGLNI